MDRLLLEDDRESRGLRWRNFIDVTDIQSLLLAFRIMSEGCLIAVKVFLGVYDMSRVEHMYDIVLG